jgi:DNA-binding LacI/PurR family transcriptional regulator
MATLEEIAREAGVSRYTVSNVLRGRNKENWACTAERAERIRAIAERLNYRPNAAAVATATGVSARLACWPAAIIRMARC